MAGDGDRHPGCHRWFERRTPSDSGIEVQNFPRPGYNGRIPPALTTVRQVSLGGSRASSVTPSGINLLANAWEGDYFSVNCNGRFSVSVVDENPTTANSEYAMLVPPAPYNFHFQFRSSSSTDSFLSSLMLALESPSRVKASVSEARGDLINVYQYYLPSV